MHMSRTPLPAALALIVVAAAAPAQGPGSCGFHLDLIANLTSTHSAVADAPLAPGSFFGWPAGVPGNPYTAWATPGTWVKAVVTVPAGTLGFLPLGAPSPLTLFWSVAAPEVPFFVGFPFIGPCAPGAPVIISVLPILGCIVDGAGFCGAAPIVPPADPGYPLKFEVTLLFPAFAPAPIKLQAVVVTPGGLIGITNGVSLFPGPNPAECSLLPVPPAGVPPCGPVLVPNGAFPVLDEGEAFGVPTPPGFMFYAVPSPLCGVNTNGFLDFTPVIEPANFSGTSADLCPPPPAVPNPPMVQANHTDLDFGILPMAPLVADLTVEGPIFDPFGITPPRTIIRWKNVPNLGSPAGPGLTNDMSAVCELWGDSRVFVVRQRMNSVTTLAHHDMVGIGPGDAIAACILPAGGLSLSTLWGIGPYVGAIFEPIWQDVVLSSQLLTNLAVEFTPDPTGIPAYSVMVY